MVSVDMGFHSHTHLLITGNDQTATPLVLLHGSGGDEQDLVPLATELAPGLPGLAIRGATPWEGGFAFFRRFTDRSIDEADLATNATALAGFIESAWNHYGFTKAPIAVGFSNGAIMASALLLRHPSLLSGAILFRPLSPFVYDLPTRIPNTPVLIIDGETDTRRSPGDGHRLAERLRHAGAHVEHHVLPFGHAISVRDMRIAQKWLAPLL